MSTSMNEKKTQAQMFTEIRNYLEQTADNAAADEWIAFLDGRIELLASQAEAAKKRKAAKKVTADPMAAAVAAQIGEKLKTVNDILDGVVDEFPEATSAKVVARLTKLAKDGVIGKTQVNLGGGKRATAYALIESMPKSKEDE